MDSALSATGSGHQAHGPHPAQHAGALQAPQRCPAGSAGLAPRTHRSCFSSAPDLPTLPLVLLLPSQNLPLLTGIISRKPPATSVPAASHPACPREIRVRGASVALPNWRLPPAPPLGAQAHQAESPGPWPSSVAHAVPRSVGLAGMWPSPAIFRVCLCGNCSWIGCRERTAKLLITALVSVSPLIKPSILSDTTPSPRRALAQWTSGQLFHNSPSATFLPSQHLPNTVRCPALRPTNHEL